MALIVGNLASNPLAESAISVAGADSYHDLRGNTAWAAIDDAEKERLLRRAGDFLIATYGTSWNYIALNTVGAPKLMAEANAELALIAKSQPLMPDPERGKKRVKVGDIEVEYDDAAPMADKFLFVAGKIKALVSVPTTSPFVKLVRT